MINEYAADLLVDPGAAFGEPSDRRALVKTALLDMCTVLALSGRHTPAGFRLSPMLVSRGDADTYDDVERVGTWLLFQALDDGTLTLDELDYAARAVERYLHWIEVCSPE